MLAANAVHFSSGSTTLLKDINVEIEPGSILVVVGPNGAGKTTLLNILSGELMPSGGYVTMQGRSLSNWRVEERAKILGVLPQQSLLNFSFRVGEVVRLGRYPHKTGAVHDSEVVDMALAAADAVHLRKRDYRTLSGGEKQRVHLARVLAQIWEQPPFGHRFLLLDEPTAALDVAHQHGILNVARSMAQQGVGVLLILHDLNMAAHYADRVVMLDKGEIAARGTVDEVLTEDNIKNIFGIPSTVMTHPQTGRPLIVYREENFDMRLSKIGSRG